MTFMKSNRFSESKIVFIKNGGVFILVHDSFNLNTYLLHTKTFLSCRSRTLYTLIYFSVRHNLINNGKNCWYDSNRVVDPFLRDAH